MFLVLKEDPAAPTGWTPVALTATETAEQAAAETNPGGNCTLAVLEWTPATYNVESVPTVIERDDSPALLARQATPVKGKK